MVILTIIFHLQKLYNDFQTIKIKYNIRFDDFCKYKQTSVYFPYMLMIYSEWEPSVYLKQSDK